MNDGVHYTNTSDDEKNKTTDILVYEYKTGKVTDTLAKGINLVLKGTSKPIDFASYQLSDDESKIIF